MKKILLFFDKCIFLFFLKWRKPTKFFDVAIVRLDAIGDYVLFRNSIKILKRNKKVFFVGNVLWKDLALELDGKDLDSWLFVNLEKFNKNLFYRIGILSMLSGYQFKEVIHPTYSRTFTADSIVKILNGTEKVGFYGDCVNLSSSAKLKTDPFYTKLIKTDIQCLFEFDRNVEFCEKYLDRKLEITFAMNVNKFKKLYAFKYIVVIPGAGNKSRIWDTKNFAFLIDFLVRRYKKKVVLIGSPSETALGESIKGKMKYRNYIINAIGKTNLVDVVSIIRFADLVVSNETSGVHIAAALNKKTVCISNGNYFGRFCPYPSRVSSKVQYFFPEEIIKNTYEKNCEKYYNGSNLDINSIVFDDEKKRIFK